MPELDYVVLCDFARREPESHVVHIIAAGIDTIRLDEVPQGQNLGIVVRLLFTRAECGRPHKLEMFIQGQDGSRIASVNADSEPQWPEDPTYPIHWTVNAALTLNMGVVFPEFGNYSLEILVDDDHKKTLNFRVVQRPQEG